MPASTGRAPAAAWAGAALFAASLAYCLYSYAVTFGSTAGGPPAALAAAANVGLFALFGVHHSVFARPAVRAWVADAVTPALERTVYVAAASVLLIAVCAAWQPVAGEAWRAAGLWVWPLRALQALGLVVTLRSAAMIDVWELAGVRQAALPWSGPSQVRSGEPDPSSGSGSPRVESRGDKARPTTATEFRTDGPYGWVRHPIYLGWVLIVWPVPVMTGTRLVFAAISTAYILAAIPLEERTLTRTSGGRYETYRRLVRWKLIPGVY